MTQLGPRYTEAVDYVRLAHANHYRKGTRIPYLYHLLGVSSLVLEFGGNEEQAIAALLHDVIEDCGSEHEAKIRAQFGDPVAAIVLACTDGSAESKSTATDPVEKLADWRRRKIAYLAHLATETDAVLLVSACDKLHNARAIVGDLESPAVGPAVFERFTAGRDGTLAYYHSLSRVFSERGSPVTVALDLTVARMHVLAGNATRQSLV